MLLETPMSFNFASLDEAFPAVDCGHEPLGSRVIVQVRKAKKIASDPSPTPGMPDANYKTMAKMKTEKVTGEGGGNGGTNSQRGKGPDLISTVMGGRR